MDIVPDTHRRVESHNINSYKDIVSKIIRGNQETKEQWANIIYYSPDTKFISRVFPGRLATNKIEREDSEQCLIDVFLADNLDKMDCVFWVDNGFLIPKPVFVGPFSPAIRRNFHNEYSHYYEMGIVSLDSQFSLFSTYDFDFSIVTCVSDHANQLDELFGGHEKICSDMKYFILTDQEFDEPGVKLWGLEHLLKISGCTKLL